ncbi:hypothetical protein ENHAE0001_1557 [Enhydrobacter aerosaccus SK60]|nr:hypothetical protein ENHAE0001_1557 [Enhydrobacter aerosaccus SK60]
MILLGLRFIYFILVAVLVAINSKSPLFFIKIIFCNCQEMPLLKVEQQ